MPEVFARWICLSQTEYSHLAYNSPSGASIEMVSPPLWRGVSAMLLFAIIGVLVLALVLASGAADPPIAGSLVLEVNDTSGWAEISNTAEIRLLQSPEALSSLPFTLQLSARNGGAPDSAWGIWLETETGRQIVLIDNQGYHSVSDTPRPHWIEFIHLRTGRNTLYLNVDQNGAATLRLNREVAWTGKLSPRNAWGIATYRGPTLTWDTLQLYASGGHT
jgi:hypothetical protein